MVARAYVLRTEVHGRKMQNFSGEKCKISPDPKKWEDGWPNLFAIVSLSKKG